MTTRTPAAITSAVQKVSRDSQRWSLRIQEAAKILCQNSKPSALSRPATVTWPTNILEKLSLAPMSMK